MTAKKTHWLRTTLVVLVICGIVGLALTGYLFFKNPTPTTASAVLEFTFQGAGDGVAPNGAAFSIADIASEDILSQALEENGLSDTYTVEQLQANLSARGIYPDDLMEQVMSYESLLNFTANRETTVTDYHPTAFNISLANGFDKGISRSGLESLLKSIITAYRAYFAKAYANGLQQTDSLFTLEDYDYAQQLQILTKQFTSVADYAQEMYTRRPSFLYENAGFNDITVRMNNLITSNISRLNAELTMHSLSKDTDRLLTQYRYGIEDLNIQLNKQQRQLKKLDELIDSYQKNGTIYVTTGSSLTRIDGNTSITYDTLVNRRETLSNGISDINAQITSYEMKLADLAGESAAEADGEADESDAAEKPQTQAEKALFEQRQASLQNKINALKQKGDAIIDDFRAMLQAYNDEEINDLTVTVTSYRYDTPSVISGAFIKLAIKTAGPICALGFMVCLVLIIRSRRREEKASEAAK